MYNKRNWKPSKAKAREFAQTMNEVADFCEENGISQSSTSDSYYFTLNGQKYRVSNHTIFASNYNSGQDYHDLSDTSEIQITAGKTRIIQVYNDLKAGYELDKRGYRK